MIEAQLKKLQLELPPAPPPGGVYHPVVITGNLLFVSGQPPTRMDGTLITGVVGKDLSVEEVICGGTPTLPCHAADPQRTLSPGTVLLWDWGYSSKFEDLKFQHAAVMMTRIISKPGHNKLCLDVGHKAIASEMAPPRLHFFDLPAYELVGHSEEHLVIALPNADQFSVGDCLYGVPIHICPTMALHDWVWAVEDSVAREKWPVTARTRELQHT